MVKDYTAVLAAYNEEDIIAVTVQAIKKIGIEKIIVVDDGSEDSTAEVATKTGAHVLKLTNNVGKGKALQQAFPLIKSPYTVLLDADLGAHASEANKLIENLGQGFDMAIAKFPKVKKAGGFGIAKGLGRWSIKHFSGFKAEAPLSGQRALRTDILKGIILENGYGIEVGLTIDVLRKGYKIIEVPTTMSHRVTGRDVAGFKHRGKQFKDILKVVIKRKLKLAK